MKPLTLYPHEIRRLLSTGSVTVWRPIKPQPEVNMKRPFQYDGTEYPWHWMERHPPKIGDWIQAVQTHVDDYETHLLDPPHPPGSERWVRETWAWDEVGIDVHYRADFSDKDAKEAFSDVGEKWRSPATMPRWASRLSVVSKAVQARQVQTVTEKEAVEAGLADLTAFSEWRQRRFDTLGPDPWTWATTLERKG